MENVQRVRLSHLSLVHEPPHLLGCRRQPFHANRHVHGFGGREVMTYRADAAEPLDDEGDFPVHPSTDEALEAPELDNVEARVFHLSGLIEPDRDLP